MKFLVTGATGKVGQHIVQEFVNAGHHVRALTRNPEKFQFPANVEVILGDLTEPRTIEAALQGVTGLHLINFGGDDYAPLQTGQEIMAMAEKAGVKRVTVLEGGEKAALESAVEASSLAWTMLKPVEFMSGALDWANSICTEGIVKQGFANRKTAIVHEADIAAVAARVLAEDGHGGKSYWITGPEVHTPLTMLDIIAKAIGRELKFIELSEVEAREQWQAEGYPEEFIEFFVWAHGNTPVEGYTVVPTVEQVTGKVARSFAQWAAENAERFRS